MSVVLHSWKPQQAEPSATPPEDLTAPRELHVEAAVGVCQYFCRR